MTGRAKRWESVDVGRVGEGAGFAWPMTVSVALMRAQPDRAAGSGARRRLRDTARSVKRSLALAFSVLVIGGLGLGAAGCGSASHYIGGVVAHSALKHVIGSKSANKIFCLYHGHRVLVDLRNHSAIFAGLNVISAVHDCTSGFLHSR